MFVAKAEDMQKTHCLAVLGQSLPGQLPLLAGRSASLMDGSRDREGVLPIVQEQGSWFGTRNAQGGGSLF